MSVDSRLQYLWKPQLGDAKPPPQQEEGTVHQQHSPQRGSNAGQDISPATIGIPIGPQGPQPPRHKKKTAGEGRDCRDRWRLGAEIATAIIGAIGIVALIVTLDQTRKATEAALQSVAVARKQMELSERPWITAEATLPRSIVFYENGDAYVSVGISLKNIGHSVATEVSARVRVILYSHAYGTLESLTEPEWQRDALCEESRSMLDLTGGGFVIFPEQGKITGSRISLASEYVKARAFEQPGAVGKFIDPVVVGCVAYRDTFTSARHVTGFVYLVSSSISRNGQFPVGETIPVENVHLTPHALVSAYID